MLNVGGMKLFEYKSNIKVLKVEIKDEFKSTHFYTEDTKLRPGL
jgi:hypothetical protein